MGPLLEAIDIVLETYFKFEFPNKSPVGDRVLQKVGQALVYQNPEQSNITTYCATYRSNNLLCGTTIREVVPKVCNFADLDIFEFSLLCPLRPLARCPGRSLL
jgi:hypothetical protein